MLRETAARMKGAIRSYDGLGRYGGEEFLFVLPGCDGPAARAHAERLRAAVAAGSIELTGAAPVYITCSVGVATLSAGPLDARALIREADRALYIAKHLGRDRVVDADTADPRLLAAAVNSAG